MEVALSVLGIVLRQEANRLVLRGNGTAALLEVVKKMHKKNASLHAQVDQLLFLVA